MTAQKKVPPYRIIDHTGDIGFEVTGRTEEEIFLRAADALLGLLADPSSVEERLEKVVQAEGSDRGELLVAFLGEVLYLHDAEDLLFRRASITSGPLPRLSAVLYGEKFDPARHSILRQIKAVTYHDLVVRERGGVWEARVILDI